MQTVEEKSPSRVHIVIRLAKSRIAKTSAAFWRSCRAAEASSKYPRTCRPRIPGAETDLYRSKTNSIFPMLYTPYTPLECTECTRKCLELLRKTWSHKSVFIPVDGYDNEGAITGRSTSSDHSNLNTSIPAFLHSLHSIHPIGVYSDQGWEAHQIDFQISHSFFP